MEKVTHDIKAPNKQIASCCPAKEPDYSFRPAIWSSSIMAIAGMGDALLYAYLPVESQQLGISALMVGTLLSVNRFVRFFANRWIAYAAKIWGLRNVFMIGVVLASGTTFAYAGNPEIWIWVMARVVWGFSYAALRFSTFQYAANTGRMGSAIGIGRSIQEAGPVLAYWLGPLIIKLYGPAHAFSGLALASLALLPISYLLPDHRDTGQHLNPLKFQAPRMTDLWVFISSFAVEGVLIVGISQIIQLTFSGTDQLLVASALYISSRRFLNIVISPLSGFLSEQWGISKIFNLSCLFIVAGLAFIIMEPNSGLLIVFLGSAINLTLLPVITIDLVPAQRSFDALTKMSTSRDIGAALGALLGLHLLSTLKPGMVLGTLSFFLLFIWFYLPKFKKFYE